MNIEYYYPIERIHILSQKYIGLVSEELSDFLKTYEQIEIKTPDPIYSNKKNYLWRKRCKFNSKDFEKYLKNKWTPNLPKNDREKIQRVVIANLNKLNEKKFTIITKELLDSLETLMYFETYEILIKELINKVKIDKHYIKIYGRLVNELFINKRWQKRIITLTNTDEGIYWSVNKLDMAEEEREFIGPFDTEKDAYYDALKTYSFEREIIKKINSIFYNRDEFIANIEDNAENFDMYLMYKNNYLNFVEFIYYITNYRFLPEDILLHLLLQFLKKFENDNTTVELEAFCHLYTIYKNSNGNVKLSNQNHQYFENRIKKIINNNTVDLKIKFVIQNLFKINADKIKTNRYDTLLEIEESSENTNEEEKEAVENINCLINEYPMHRSSDLVSEMLGTINSKYDRNLIESIINELLLGSSSHFDEVLELLSLVNEKRDLKNVNDVINQYKDDIEEYELDYPNIKQNIEKVTNAL